MQGPPISRMMNWPNPVSLSFYHYVCCPCSQSLNFSARIHILEQWLRIWESNLLRIWQFNTFLICRLMKLHFEHSGHEETKAVICECGKLYPCGTAGAYYFHRWLFIFYMWALLWYDLICSGFWYSLFCICSLLWYDLICSGFCFCSFTKNITVMFNKNNLCSYDTRTFLFYCRWSGMLFLDPDVLWSGI